MEKFLNKQCKLILLDGFTLHGVVTGINDYGITFETTQKTSFISFKDIKRLQEED
jgi:sRNA-binding regulator protein Hfq